MVRSIFWGFEDIQFQDSLLPSPPAWLRFQIGFQVLQAFEIPSAPRVGGFLDLKLDSSTFWVETRKQEDAEVPVLVVAEDLLSALMQTVKWSTNSSGKFYNEITMISEVGSSG